MSYNHIFELKTSPKFQQLCKQIENKLGKNINGVTWDDNCIINLKNRGTKDQVNMEATMRYMDRVSSLEISKKQN